MSHKNCPTKLQVSNLAKDTTHKEMYVSSFLWYSITANNSHCSETWMSGLRVSGATITKKKDSFILEFESAAQVFFYIYHIFNYAYHTLKYTCTPNLRVESPSLLILFINIQHQ